MSYRIIKWFQLLILVWIIPSATLILVVVKWPKHKLFVIISTSKVTLLILVNISFSVLPPIKELNLCHEMNACKTIRNVSPKWYTDVYIPTTYFANWYIFFWVLVVLPISTIRDFHLKPGQPGDKPLSEPMMGNSPTHIYLTRPQWVKNVGKTWMHTYCIHQFLEVPLWKLRGYRRPASS